MKRASPPSVLHPPSASLSFFGGQRFVVGRAITHERRKTKNHHKKVRFLVSPALLGLPFARLCYRRDYCFWSEPWGRERRMCRGLSNVLPFVCCYPQCVGILRSLYISVDSVCIFLARARSCVCSIVYLLFNLCAIRRANGATENCSRHLYSLY